ncbi:MAG TPA: aconitase family protein [Polyangiaceae bacterium]|nr:aconitase family protein [Polyangiaceae bacterium]
MSDGFSLTGRVLVLCESLDVLKAQLKGSGRAVDLAAAGPLRNGVSVDEIVPPWASFFFDAQLAHHCLVGLTGGGVEPGELQAGGFQVLVAGDRFGRGASSDVAPLALLEAGIRLIVARSVDKSFLQSCQDFGLHVTSDFSVFTRLLQSGRVPQHLLLQGLDGLVRDLVEAGGLSAYNEARLAGRILGATVTGTRRPMTLAEKLIAAHVVRPKGLLGAPSVMPGQTYFVRTHLRYSSDRVTALADALLRGGFGDEASVAEPQSIALFREPIVQPAQLTPEQRELVRQQRLELEHAQNEFAAQHGLQLSDPSALVNELVVPGSIVVGPDPRGCRAGALGALAFEVSGIELANAFLTRDARVRVPESVSIELSGELRPGVTAYDVVQALLESEPARAGAFQGRVLELSGSGVGGLSLDERVTLTSLAASASALSAILPFDKRARAELAARRGGDLDLPLVGSTSDDDAQFAATVELDLSSLERNAS